MNMNSVYRNYLKMDGEVTLTGGGTVTLNGSNNRISGVASTDRLINVNNTIQGAGNIGDNSMALTNQGTIDANLASSNLYIDLSSAGINDGIFKASNGGTLYVYDDISGTGNWVADA